MLFTRGQGQDKAAPAVLIDRFSNQTARHIADITATTSEQPEPRSTVAERDAQALALGDGNINAEFTRRLEDAQCGRLGCYRQGQSRQRHWDTPPQPHTRCRPDGTAALSCRAVRLRPTAARPARDQESHINKSEQPDGIVDGANAVPAQRNVWARCAIIHTRIRNG